MVRNSRNKSIVSQVKFSDANSNSSSEIAKLTHAVNQQTSVVTTAMTAILKQFQATPPPASVKAVEEICVTCGGAHPYYQCLAAGGNTFLELWDISKDTLQQPQLTTIKNMMASFFQMNTASTSGLGSLPSNTIANPKGELKSITTRSGIVLDGTSVPIPPPFVNPKEDERVKKTLTDQDLAEYTIKEKLLELANTPLNENCSAVIIKKLPEKLRDPRKFLIPYGFSELKCKSLADLEGGNVLPEKLLDLDSTKDLHPPHHINQLSGSTTSLSSPNHLLKEFAVELALITFPLGNNDLPLDIESDLKEIEYLLHHDPIKDMDSILKYLIDQSNLADLNDNLVDTMPEMFIDEHALDYSSPPLYDKYDDDLFEVESDTEYVYDDPFDSKGEKIKEPKLLIDELDLLSDFLHSFEYDSFFSEDFSEVNALPLTNNKDTVFNPGILIQENLYEIITCVAPDKKLAISHASLIPEDFDPPLYELPIFNEVPSDHETHFYNDQFVKVMLKYSVTHSLATAYHPQTRGQAFRTAYKTPIGCTPYKLIYEKACHLSIELEHKAHWALKHVNFDIQTAGDHKKVQLNELRNQAYENSLIYKEKTKRLHDSKIKERVFNIGDRVLLFNSRLKIFSGKLKSRWSGPFTVTHVFPYGIVELSQTDGSNFKVNGHRLKHYFGEDIPKMVVPDLQTFFKDQ
nr:reverse transcriptase domain-containing protein [Tanacetum cinerariifolium]